MTDAAAQDRAAGESGVLAIAHRGDPVTFRENTVASIRAAIETGADVVEIDVKTTSDGVSIVLHDDSLSRLWEVERDIRTMTAAEVAGLEEAPDHGIPTLEEVLRLFSGTSTAVLVDMDSGEWAGAALDCVRRAVDEDVLRPRQVIWCGHLDGMREIREADPRARIFLSWGEQARGGPPDADLVRALGPEAFNPHWLAVEAFARDWSRGAGLALSCWTVDDPGDMRRLVEGGVDAMISNRIRDLLGVLGRG